MTEATKIEFENEKEASPDEAEEIPVSEATHVEVPKKKVSSLSEEEKKQLIEEAKSGKESQYYKVTFCKNGNTKITQRRQTKTQQLLNESAPKEAKQEVAKEVDNKRYLTDTQLMLEHLINLETSFMDLRLKHKKLKKRYNELEGYLYADEADTPERLGEPKPLCGEASPQIQDENEVGQNRPTVETSQTPQPQPQNPSPQVQRRYVRSWRDIKPRQ